MDPASGSPSAMQGRRLGDFVLREQIGHGGQGAVYRAEQEVLGREAAVKVVATVGKSRATLTRFLREIKIAAQLDHPFAAHIYAFGIETDIVWVAMEYVHGRPLDQIVKTEGGIPLRRFLPLLDRLCEVVHSAHEQGIIHRDIKPANVMVLARAGRLLPKLLDLGIAKAVSTPELELEARDSTKTEESSLSQTDEDSTRSVPAPPQLTDTSTSWGGDGSFVGSFVNAGITQQGMILGSPPYMAPEAWTDPTTVDKRVDIYALGILAYECLSGRRPFRATSEYALAELHMKAEPPPLGAEFPAALDHALRGALAKRPEDRYATPIELANAMRAAAAQMDSGLPRLDAELRTAWMVHAPQPWAESLALLHAARSEEQAWDAIGRLQRATLQYLGVLALAMYTQAQHTEPQQTAMKAALAELTAGALSLAGWTAVIRAACLPFAAEPQRAAVPELVRAVWGMDRVETSLLDELASLDRRQDDTGGESEALPTVMDTMGRMLRLLAFAADYPLGVRRGDGIDSLMGLRRSTRETLSNSAPDVALGSVVLLDRDGKLRLRLSPLVTVSAAAPGLADEVFVLEGADRRGMKQIALPGMFERHEEEARGWLEQNLLIDSGAADEGNELQAPYLGLSTFRAEDVALFFGREREVESFVNRLRIGTLLTVVGPSGAGKSSFLQAGVLPALPRDTLTIIVRPGRTPLATLVARLEREKIGGLTVDGIKQDAALLGRRIELTTQASGAMCIVIVDQLEELFTLCLDNQEREAYGAALVALSEVGERVRVLFTLRDDFLVRAEELRSFRSRIGAGLQLVTTPQRDDLLRILIEPLRARGYSFEDASLPAEMVDSVQAQPGALALLSFTAMQLWEARDKHFQRLTRRAYTNLGGVGGALAQHAEATLTGLPTKEQALTREAFRHLVTSQGTRATLTRVELHQLLGNDEVADSMLEKLVAARLLVTQEGEGGVNRVEIIHEALLSAWPRLVRWQREDSEAARLRDAIRAAARQWEQRGRASGLLWREDALAEYRLWRARYKGALTSSEESFGAASVSEALRGRRLRAASLTVVMVAMAIFSAFLWRANRVAREAHTRAELLLRDSYFEQGRQFSLRNDPLQALVYFAEAQRLGASGPAFDFLVTNAAIPLRAQARSFGQASDGQLFDADISADGRYVATASSGKSARIYAATGGVPVWQHDYTSWVSGAFFLPDANELITVTDRPTRWRWNEKKELGSGPAIGIGFMYSLAHDSPTMLYGSFDGKAASWNWSDNKSFVVVPGSSVDTLGYSVDQRRFYTSNWGRQGALWDTASKQKLATMPADPNRAAFAPHDDRLAVLSGDDGMLTIFDDAGNKQRSIPATHKGGGSALTWSEDGTLLASAGADNEVRLWKSASLEAVRDFSGHTQTAQGLQFFDGTSLVSYGVDGTIRFWDVRTGTSGGQLIGHKAQISTVKLSHDREWLLSASYDGTARLWRWRDAIRARVLPLESNVEFEADFGRLHESEVPPQPSYGEMSPRGDRVGAYDSKRNLWIGTLDGKTHCRLGDGTINVREAAFTMDGEHVFTAERTPRSIGMWRASDCSLERRLTGHDDVIRTVRTSRDGRYVVSGSADGTAKLWDVHTGALVRTFVGTSGMAVRVDLSEDGELLYASYSVAKAVSNDRQFMTAWRVADGNVVWSLGARKDDPAYGFFHLLPGKRIIFADWNGRLSLLDAQTGHSLRTVELSRDAFHDFVVSPDGKRLVVNMRNRNALVLDASTLATIGELDSASPHSIAFSRDSSLVFMAGSDTLKLFELSTRRLLGTQTDADYVLPDPTRDRVVLLPYRGAARVWDIGVDQRAVQGLRELVRCRVTFKLEGGQVTVVDPPADCAPDL